MLVFLDINEVWRRKPFGALAEKTGVLGVAPADWMVARRSGFQSLENGAKQLNVVLPPGWASKTAALGQRILWSRIVRRVRAEGEEISGLMVTSPHYLPLLNLVPRTMKTFYYASDDYRSYDGWDAVARREQELIERVDHAFFVSRGLLLRAQEEYGVDPAKLSVSPNATEPRFFPVEESMPVEPPSGTMERPVAGIVGGINDRLDFALLRRCADLPNLGTLLLVGPLPPEPGPELAALLEHPKCRAVGRQPHDAIHRWFQCLDVGLIPYKPTEFNRLCSPMRLYDHLASGAPVAATTACEQVAEFGEQVCVCGSEDEFVQTLETLLQHPPGRFDPSGILWADRAEAMLKMIEEHTRA